MSYLIVDAADDSILAECESPGDLLRTMLQIRKEQPEREVHVASLGEHHGELVSTQSIVTARALTDQEGFALYGRRRA